MPPPIDDRPLVTRTKNEDGVMSDAEWLAWYREAYPRMRRQRDYWQMLAAAGVALDLALLVTLAWWLA